MFLIIILEIQSGGQQKQFVSFLESSALPRFCAAHNAMHLCFLYVFCVRGQQIGTHIVLHIKYPVLDLHLSMSSHSKYQYCICCGTTLHICFGYICIHYCHHVVYLHLPVSSSISAIHMHAVLDPVCHLNLQFQYNLKHNYSYLGF